MKENTLRVEVEIDVDMRAIAAWPPEVASALMKGMAHVLTAHQQLVRSGGGAPGQ